MGSLVLSKFWHGVRNPYEVVYGRAGFFLKIIFCHMKEPEEEFFELIGKFGYYFFLNLLSHGSLYYMLCFCINLIFGETPFPGVWAKMLSANQIAGCLN